MTAEDFRSKIIKTMLENPVLGENYIDWHDDDGMCGLTIVTEEETFDLIITQRIF